MATKSSKSLCTSATAIMDSRGSGGAVAGPGLAVTADNVSRRNNIQARRTEIQTGRRNTSLPLKARSQKFSENIRFCRVSLFGRILGCQHCISQQPEKYGYTNKRRA